MAPYPRITCYPPLSQLTVLLSHQSAVSFVVVIEWSRSRPDFPFEFCVLYDRFQISKHFSQYSCLPLRRLESEPALYGSRGSVDYRATFGGPLLLESPGRYSFTIKYRVDQLAPWQYVDTLLGTGPGILLLQQPLDLEHSIPPFLALESGWNIQKLGTPGPIAVFQLSSDEMIPKTGEMSKIVLGQIQTQVRYFSLVRLEPYWLGPRQGEDFFHLSEDSILCSFITESGTILTLLALSGIDHVISVVQSDNGRIAIAAQNDGNVDCPYQFFCALGTTVEATIEAVMTTARNLVTQTESIKLLKQEFRQSVSPDNPLESFYDGLVYCTWNALGQDLSSTKILGALDTLATNGIDITTLLIDDNWQTLGSTDYDYSDSFMRGFSDFPANEAGFPTGLKGLITEIRQRHPQVQDIGVWHALFGYWAGLARDSPLTQRYKTKKIDTRLMGNIPSVIEIVNSEDIERFYNDFYQFLADSGITFIKTDVQHMLGQLLDSSDRQSIPTAYQRAWTLAHLHHFQGKAISCMSQIQQTMFHSLLQDHTPRIVMRNSDDFYPEVAASHPWHVWTNAHNALFTQHLNVLPDWDMFQTSHDFSAYHAASRCVSGSPISVTDCPGEHDITLINQITAKSPDGRTIALRPNIGKTMRVFDRYTDGTALHIGTTTGSTSILGLFNTGNRDISLLVAPTDFPHLDRTTAVVRSFCTKQISGPIQLDGGFNPKDLIHLHLPVRGWDILSSHTVHSIVGKDIAILGLQGKMCGPAAIVSSGVESSGDKIKIRILLKALGILEIWVGGLSTDDRIGVSLEGENVGWKLDKAALYDILAVDISEAWKSRRSRNEKSTQVEVIITISCEGH